jgi:aspartyl aminopeptidase
MNTQVPIEDSEQQAQALELARDLLTFLDQSPCNLFAVQAIVQRLEAAGFAPLSEAQRWELQPGGRYYVERDGTAVIAFVVGQEAPEAAGFRMVGAHTDSPGFKVKPNPEKVHKGLVTLGVEVYGGPIYATWTDRDLGLCGRVLVRGSGGDIEQKLYRSAGFVTLPNIAIHQNREANDKGLKLNPQTELSPVLGSVAHGLPEEHALRWLLARDLGIEQADILDHDLFLYDTQPASFAGVHGELMRSGRFDDLGMCHAALGALVAGAETPCAATRMAVLVDAEEVGSETPQGARSNLLPHTLERIVLALGGDRQGFLASLASTIMVSADNAHAIHPGYGDRQDGNHAPVLNGGPVIKAHAGRKYATDGYSAAVFELACERADVPFQRFVNRSDVRSGGTIGSMTAAQLGIPIVDVGAPQYAMHSVRECAGTWDHWYMARAMGAFYLG